ncbi:hypothetical protein SASPL_128708 [Salvia splendens]|uniref:Stress up-regulated Nod 19 n=1 Tax=Salvia splendens TaxID=180675 RepID=A0A8X8XEK9_SALSN|nr:uncharacterized protein LOC121750581 [Salvia splendens]KAG6410643.1 hypothetical protein SASPL_128708 [Salvia splendens]
MAANLAIIMITILFLVIHHQTTTMAATNVVKTEVFRSPEIVMEPGLVSNKNYFKVDFPGGHIGLKSFNAELVDERGDPVPLHQVYLHHWVLNRYFARRNSSGDNDLSIVRNSGICENGLSQYFGVGAETRRTSTYIPHPYAIQVGDPATIPEGYEEGWVLNVHAIDTRGADDKMGCTECRCDLYGFSEAGGGLHCCPDDGRCRLKQGFHGENKRIYLRYTVKYVEWDSSSILPVDIYILDVTDVWTKADQSKGIRATHHCKVEYGVESCGGGVEKDGCVDTESVSFSFPVGGEVVYGVGHQHAGGVGTTLYGQGGRPICSSKPIYGEGNEAGNEVGFIVGMSTCYPTPDAPVKISVGETLTLVSNYSSLESHTGVMALFYLLLAHTDPKPLPTLASKFTMVPEFVWPVALLGLVVIVIVVAWNGRNGNSEGYEAIP